MHKDQARAISAAPLWGHGNRIPALCADEIADTIEAYGAYGILNLIARALRTAAARSDARTDRRSLLCRYAGAIEDTAAEIRAIKDMPVAPASDLVLIRDALEAMNPDDPAAQTRRDELVAMFSAQIAQALAP